MYLPSITPIFECEGGMQVEGQWLELLSPYPITDPLGHVIPSDPSIATYSALREQDSHQSGS